MPALEVHLVEYDLGKVEAVGSSPTKCFMDDATFTALVRAAIEECSVADIASRLHVSLPGVRLWAEGKNLPYRTVRPLVAKWLEAQRRDV